MVKCFFSVSKYARPTSTVFPLSLSSWLVSKAQDKYLGGKKTEIIYHWKTLLQIRVASVLHLHKPGAHTYQVSRFFSLASLSYFSKVLLSTMPVRYLTMMEKQKTNNMFKAWCVIPVIFHERCDSRKLLT